MITFLRFIPALLWAGTIYYLSSQPDLPQPPLGFEGIDKLMHAAAYGGLMVWCLVGDRGRRSGVWLGVVALYGLTDELHQALVPGRSPDVVDWLADVAGAAMIWALWRYRSVFMGWGSGLVRSAPRERPPEPGR